MRFFVQWTFFVGFIYWLMDQCDRFAALNKINKKKILLWQKFDFEFIVKIFLLNLVFFLQHGSGLKPTLNAPSFDITFAQTPQQGRFFFIVLKLSVKYVMNPRYALFSSFSNQLTFPIHCCLIRSDEGGWVVMVARTKVGLEKCIYCQPSFWICLTENEADT